MADEPTPSDLVAERIKDLRQRKGFATTKALAQRCVRIGAPQLTASVLMNIESGRRDVYGRRRRHVTVDELHAFAAALDIAPVDLLPEMDEEGGGAGSDLAAELAALRHITSDLDGYLERRAAELAAPRIAEAEVDAQRRIDEMSQELERERDLTAEMRRQITALVKTSEGLRSRLDEAGVPVYGPVPPRSDDGRAALRELLGCIWLYVDWRYVTKQLTTEQKEMWADAVDSTGDPADSGPKAERWWRPEILGEWREDELTTWTPEEDRDG